MNDENMNEELRQIAPGLSDLKRGDGFATPHNYFNELPDRVFAKIEQQEQKPVATWSWLDMFKPRYAVAFASVMVLIVAGIWYARLQTNQDINVTVTRDEALEYVLANLHEFSNDDLAAAGVFADWDATDVKPVTKDELDQMMEEMMEEMVN